LRRDEDMPVQGQIRGDVVFVVRHCISLRDQLFSRGLPPLSRSRSSQQEPSGRRTSAFIIAVGPSQLARRDVGTPVFGGMILASFVGIFAIPPLYVTFQSLRERLRPKARPAAAEIKAGHSPQPGD
jgi:hypothetical protein